MLHKEIPSHILCSSGMRAVHRKPEKISRPLVRMTTPCPPGTSRAQSYSAYKLILPYLFPKGSVKNAKDVNECANIFVKIIALSGEAEAFMFHIIVNPSSSSGRGKSKWDKIESRFRQSGVPYKVHFSSSDNTIEKICEELTSRGEDCNLVVLGGDGTMNAVVNGIQDFEHTRVGFIQTGSGNDLIKGLGIKKRRGELVDSILRGKTVRTCDIGRITYHNQSSLLDPFTHKPLKETVASTKASGSVPAADPVRLFNISAGIGFDAAVCQRADGSALKTLLNSLRMGKLIYISEAIHMILASPMVGMKINCDGRETFRPRTLFAVVMNTCYEGGGFKFCPDAVSNDGVLGLFGAGDLNRLNFFRIFPTAYNGNHLRFKGLFSDKGKCITIRSADPLWVHTDGEVTCMSSNITIDVSPHKLQLLM